MGNSKENPSQRGRYILASGAPIPGLTANSWAPRSGFRSRAGQLNGADGTLAAGVSEKAWNVAVDEKVKSGMSRAAAVRAVNGERPGLREQMLAEHNAAYGRSNLLAGSNTRNSSAASGVSEKAWKVAVDEKVKSGMSRAAAVRAVNGEKPGLREQMLAEHNAAYGGHG